MSTSPPLVVADRYRLVAPLGQGGMGRVWRATDVVLHREVAIKELVPPPGLTPEERQEMRERSLREARAIARLNNINVVRVFDVLRTDADPWIVMEYVPSRSLQDILAQDGPFTPIRAAEIGVGVLNALRAAHRAGVVHRDVKPGNVLIGEDGRVVLTDFGLATVPGDPNVTRTGLVLGSPAYIAPERARDGTAGPGADLWSLGATLYAAVEGASPFARPSAIATLAALATENPPPARNAGPLKPVLNGLLRKDPAHRIDAEEAERLLLRAIGRRSKLSFPMSPTMRRPGIGRERPAPSTPPVVPGISAPVVPGPRPPVTPSGPQASPPGRKPPVTQGRAAPPVTPGRAQVTPPTSPAHPPADGGRPPVFAPGKAAVGRAPRPNPETPTRIDGPRPPALDATRIDGPPAIDPQNLSSGTGTARPRPAEAEQEPGRDRPALDATMRGSGSAFGQLTAADVAAHRKKPRTPATDRQTPSTQRPAPRDQQAPSPAATPQAAASAPALPKTPTTPTPTTPGQAASPAVPGQAAPTSPGPAHATTGSGPATAPAAGSSTPGSPATVLSGTDEDAQAEAGADQTQGEPPTRSDSVTPSPEAAASASPEMASAGAETLKAGITAPPRPENLADTEAAVVTESDAATPDTDAPEAAVPDATAPAAATEEAAAAGTAAPDKATPGAAAPDKVTPGAAAPDKVTPGAAAPDNATPDKATPSSTAAGTAAADAPDATASETPGSPANPSTSDISGSKVPAARVGEGSGNAQPTALSSTEGSTRGADDLAAGSGVPQQVASSASSASAGTISADRAGTDAATPDASAQADADPAAATAEESTAATATQAPKAAPAKPSRKKGRGRATTAPLTEKPATADPAATDATAAGPAAPDLAETGPGATGPAATDLAATGSAPTEQAATGQAATGQAATEQAATEQAATGQAATEQAATEQAATEQAATDPAATGPAASGTEAAAKAAAAGALLPADPETAVAPAAQGPEPTASQGDKATPPRRSKAARPTAPAKAAKPAAPAKTATPVRSTMAAAAGADADSGRTRILPGKSGGTSRERAAAAPVSGAGLGQPSRPAWQPMTVRAPSSGGRGITVFGTTLTRRQTFIAIGVLVAVLLALVVLVPVAFAGDDEGGDDARKGAVPVASGTKPPTAASTPAPGAPAPSKAAPSSAPASSAPPSSAPASSPAGFTMPDGWYLYQDRTGFSVPIPKGASIERRGTEVYFQKDNRLLIVDQTDQPQPDPVADWEQQERDRRGSVYKNYKKIRLESVKYFQKAADWEFTYTTSSGNPQHAQKRGLLTSPNQAYGISWYTSPGDWDASLKDLQAIYQGFKPKS